MDDHIPPYVFPLLLSLFLDDTFLLSFSLLPTEPPE